MPRAFLRGLPLAAALSACASLHDGSGSRQPGATVTVQLLAINDLHGHLEPPSGSNGRINSIEAGGAAYLATHLKNAIAEHPDSIVVAAGDLVGASPMASSMFHDEPAIEALNAMGLTLASVGNHEFDEGYDEILRLRRGGCHPKDGCLAGESPLRNVVADAQLAATSGAERGAVVAFMNRGGIRADIVAAPQAPADRPRPVTYGDLYSVQPFANVVMAFTMTGDMIKRLLEQQFDNPLPGAAKMLQVSSGFTYRYRSVAPAGQHVDADSIALDGRRIAPTDRLRVAASDFLVDGGDAFTVFAKSTDRLAIVADIVALVDYFKARSPVSPPLLNRIVRTD